MRPPFTPKDWLTACVVLLLAVALVVLWNSTQTLLTVVRAERQPHPAPSTHTAKTSAKSTARSELSAQQKPAPPAAPASTAKSKTPTPASQPPAEPVVISDNRSWTFAAGYLESAEAGLLHFGGGIGLAYVDGTWLTSERAAVAFNNGDAEATTITIPDQATLRVGNDTVNIEGGCTLQSTNGQLASISADRITINRPVTNTAPAAAP